MSLDVYLNSSNPVTETCICSCCDNEHEKTYYPQLYHANITHNLGRMADAAGIYDCLWRPHEQDYSTAAQIIELMEKGLEYILCHPKEMRALEPENKWGTYENLVKFVYEYLEACKEHPTAKINVLR